MYLYENEKAKLFTDDGQRMFVKALDHVRETLKKSGAIRMDHAISILTGDSWQMMACIDRMIELDYIKEIDFGKCAGQHRIFVSKN